MKEKSNKFLTIVFGVLAILLAGYIYWQKLCVNETKPTKSIQNCKENKCFSYKDVSGLYGATIKNDNTEESIKHFIYLMDNAMFSYVLKGEEETVVYVGNYYVDSNNIILNYWFDTDSSLEKFSVINNKEKLSINSNKTISLENKHVLKEITGEEKNNEISNKAYDINHILNQATSGVRQ